MASDAQREPTMEEILASIKRIIAEDDPAPLRRGVMPQAAAPSAIPSVSVFEDDVSDGLADLVEADPEVPAKEGVTDLGFELEEFDDSFTDDTDVPRTGSAAGDRVEPGAGSHHLDTLLGAFDTVDAVANPDDDETLEDLAESLAAGSHEVQEHHVPQLPPEDDRFVPVAPVQPVNTRPEGFTAMATSSAHSDRLLDDSAALAAASSMSRLIGRADLSGDTSLEGVVREMLRPMIKEWLDANLPAIVEAKVEAAVDRIVKLAR